MRPYLLTIFLGSFLLFQIQPVIGKYILPWYGGSPAVWNTCMLFFQLLLLAGYCYAHLATALDRKKQGGLHLLLLVAALVTFPIAPSPDIWLMTKVDMPVFNILLLLLKTVGLPYLVLAATAPLVAHWFVRSFPERSPFRLYALSNAGSLLALLSFPVVVEPLLTRGEQLLVWQWGFAVFALCCGWCGLQPLFSKRGERRVAVAVAFDMAGNERPAWPLLLLWLGLSCSGSTLLLSTTNLLCQDVAVVPFLWVIPLVLYLLSYIFCFNSDRVNNRALWAVLLIIAVLAVSWVDTQEPLNLWINIAVFMAVLFAGCMACHGELARCRPHPRHLTAYYLVISAGGALGGIFVSILAPLVFKTYWEYPLALTGSCLLVVAAWQRAGLFSRGHRRLLVVAVVGQVAFISIMGYHLFAWKSAILFNNRNFFGVQRVLWEEDCAGQRMTLRLGTSTHGWQYSDPGKRMWPTSYYGADSGVGLALRFHPHRLAAMASRQNLRVGVIGLGVGTLATYGRRGDYFRFYEINPAVIWLADNLYGYLRDSSASIEVVQGDARLNLENELHQNRIQDFDVLVVDAFSSGAIPVHLLTRECFAVYREHLKHDGLLLIHISNKFLDLFPAVLDQGKMAGFSSIFPVSSPPQAEIGVMDADWVVLARGDEFFTTGAVKSKLSKYIRKDSVTVLWTDDFASLWEVLLK